MISSFTKTIATALLCCLCCPLLFSQNGIEWQPELSLTWQASSRWEFNVKTLSYHTRAAAAASTAHLEGALTGAYRLLDGSALSLGYAFRLREPFDAVRSTENRLTWQYVGIQRKGKYRTGHRLRAEQRFRPAGLIHRWRYRLSLDFPLDGERLDPGELYAKGAGELLWSIQSGELPEGESRLSGGLGIYLSPGATFELIAEYRLSDSNLAAPAHRLIIFSTCYLNL